MKHLKTIALLLLALAALFCFAACGEEEKEVKPLNELLKDIQSAATLPEMMDMDGNDLMDFLGLPASAYTESIAEIPMVSISGDMLFVFRAADKAGLDKIKTGLENYRTQKLNEFRDYIPAEAAKIEQSAVETSGDYVWLVVSENSDAILKVIEGAIK